MKGLFPFLVIFGSGAFTGGATTVELFLPDILQDHVAVRDLSLRADGNELYFSSQSLFGEISVIFRLKRDGKGQWGKPELASFSGDYNDLEPFLSPNGLRLYFASNRPRGESAAADYDLWYVERDDPNGDWSSPVNMGEPVNSGANEFYPAVTATGDFYFTTDREGSAGKDDIFHWKAGSAEGPSALGAAVNSEGYEFNAFVAPDGSFLIYTAYNRDGGHGSGDLYISYRQEDGSWGASENLGPDINSSRMDYCPFVDGEGSLYFTSKRINFPAPPYGILDAAAFLEITRQSGNGQSRLYKVVAPGFSTSASKQEIEP